MKKLLNLEYAAIHGSYWMFYGVICSFASTFLLGRGYSNWEIGVILAVGNVVAVMLQPLAADLADRSKKVSLTGLTQLMTIILMVLTVGMLIMEKKSIALSVIFVLTVAWVTVLQPLINSLSFKLQECGIHVNFGMGRSFGSLGYSVMCAFLGTLVENHGVGVLPITGELVLVFLLVSLFLTRKQFHKLKKRNKNETHIADSRLTEDADDINLVTFIKRHKVFFIVNLGVLGVYFSNAVLNNFMLQIVTNVGGDSGDMGRIFSVMAFLEIPTMFCFDAIRKKFTCQQMLKVAAICFTLKIGVCVIAESVAMVFAAQFLQVVSFALFLPAMVHFIDEIMSKGEAVKGQALFTMMITVTTVFASLIGGVILDYSGAFMLTLVATIFTAVGAVVIIVSVDKVKIIS